MAVLVGMPARATVIYSETFDGPSVPANWFAQDGSNGPALIEIADDTGGIDTGNALSINAFTQQGVIGEFDEVSLDNVGDTVQLSFDVRLESFSSNSGGFRFGLYHDNDGLAFSSGYRIIMGTGGNAPRTQIQADGGDEDIAFGFNRQNPLGYITFLNGIADEEPHSFVASLTRTVDGVLINTLQNGVPGFPVEHIPNSGHGGVPTPLQTRFNQIVFTTAGGIVGMVDNVTVELLDTPPPTLLGDYSDNGVVDAADYTVWRDHLGSSVTLPNDPSPGVVDQSGYAVWRNNFGAGVPGPPPQGTVVYSETFDGPSVPANWFAQDGSQGQAFLDIIDDTGGINTGNALSINAFTRQGIIGEFDEVSLDNVGDTVQLSFDVRLESFPNNSSGFRFGLYHDNEGLAHSSGYRIFVGTGDSGAPQTTIQADGGDDDILFGVNRENPPGFTSYFTGIANEEPHSFLLSVTRTVDGVLITTTQDGVTGFPVEHITGAGAGVPTPLQTVFNQIVFSTNGGIAGTVDNVSVEFISASGAGGVAAAVPEPSTWLLLAVGGMGLAVRQTRRSRRNQ